MKNTFSEKMQGIGVTGQDVYLQTKPLNSNKRFCLQAVSVANLTNSGDTATIGIKRGSDITYLKTITLTSSAYYYLYDTTIHYDSTKNVIIKFSGTTDGDKLEANVFGYLVN